MHSIIRMFSAAGYEIELTYSEERVLTELDYDFLWLPCKWIDLDAIPERIRVLLGPCHFEFPQGPLCGQPNKHWSRHCIFTCSSVWHGEMFKEFTGGDRKTTVPVLPLPLGIDTKVIQARVAPTLEEAKVVVYSKYRHPFLIEFCTELLKEKGIKYEVFTYGYYKDAEFKAALQRAPFCIWIGCTETQGYAFQECLAMNVPIVCLDATSMFDTVFPETDTEFYRQYMGVKSLVGTTCSWWSEECGVRIKELEELEEAIEEAVAVSASGGEKWSPRRFVERELSDAVCFERIQKAFTELESSKN